MSIGKISIDLNPRRENKVEAALQKIVVYNPVLMLLAGFILLIIIGLQLYIFSKAGAYSHYNKKWIEWGDKVKLIEDIKSKTDSLSSEKEAVEKIVTPEFEMSKILADIFSSLPRNIAIRTLHFDGEKMKMWGYVVRWGEDPLVSLSEKFINSLKKKDYFLSKFGKVEIIHTRRSYLHDVEVLDFDLKCEK